VLTYELTATGGETLIALPWPYTLDTGMLAVEVASAPAEYFETDPTHITLRTPLLADQVCVVRAQLPTLFDSVGRDWLANDPNKLAEGIVGALDATAAELIAELRGFTRVFDPARCEPRYLPYLARKLGWDLDTSRSTIRTAAGGETVMTLSFRYTPGHDPPEVWVNGRPAAFTESSPSTITLAAPLAPGDALVVVYCGETRL
jgi:hypothetical protein